MRRLISDTAKWGELTVGPKIIDQTVRKHMKSALTEIRSGKFARQFIREIRTGSRRRARLVREAERHPIEKVGVRLRRLMSWKQKTDSS
jgi:ketol-acid reductoisomerase